MNQANSDQLRATYHRIFPRDFHFECSDGWFSLIDRLCSTIQYYVDISGENQPTALQLKEKFGALRFYLDEADTTIQDLVHAYEGISRCVCEDCGNKGKIRKGGWLKVRCDECEMALHPQEPDDMANPDK